MKEREIVALILAGGKGSRLGSLTKHMPKPAVFYGGDYRIIDFTVSNCINSGIDTIGILTQYFSDKLHDYIDSLDLDHQMPEKNVYKMASDEESAPYLGTADAVYKNIEFLEQHHPEYVLILSGDHIYKMDYSKMLNFHKESGAAVTIASKPVEWTKASGYGILYCGYDGNVYGFDEKPRYPKSNLASMGVYMSSF